MKLKTCPVGCPVGAGAGNGWRRSEAKRRVVRATTFTPTRWAQ